MECYSLYTISITIICLLGVLFIPKFHWSNLLSALKSGLLHGFARHNYAKPVNSSTFSVEAAFTSFQGYASATKSEIQNVRSKFNTLRGGHRRMAMELGYQQKIERMESAHRANHLITRRISSLATEEFPHLAKSPTPSGLHSGPGTTVSTMKVRESLKHMVRDWSEEGKRERDAIYKPILSQLAKIPMEERRNHKVLVPGSGLGRLAWEIANLGFDTTSCELSYYMSLCLRFLLSENTTERTNQHTLHPYSHWWSHQRSNENTFRGISLPDVLPRRIPNWTLLEEDFLGLSPPLNHGGYDTIVTLFFIDTASNIISYLSQIYHLLRPGGKWINLGPLLYYNSTIELNLEEVLQLADLIGFDIDEESRCRLPSEYTADKHAMMQWVYQPEFWVATKRSDELIL
ncbi:N2227-domain-containing protein [Serendipita vermifera]|nr:N2227-domain-containing protein [Serendipita vermifera]